MATRTKWRKVLYENQGVPDNYVDETFLDELKKNLYTRKYDYWSVLKESGVVTQQISSVCLFVVVYISMSEKMLSPELLFLISSLLTLIGYITYDIIDDREGRSESGRSRVDDLKTVVMFIGFSFGLSPVLVSLTETISTDTIYAMTTITLLANLLCHDYGANSAMVSWSVSLNAGLFASVCLASRLHSSTYAFSLVTFSLELFALWPLLRRKLKTCPSSHILLTVLSGIGAALMLLHVSAVCAILYILLHIFITFVCPAWLISLQPFKNNIYGPWDEAVIQDS
ncbi:phosphatidylinositol N-acetylglucosaminyltransferase subunit C-like isoform X1 [Liolophura sinensis]|uniref:phosphatidylinositol N-acetylglucosaminyltransferase subunit C-like isoform X1 n=1 Tax=Liolophura sinensis TaxID=3198878 RepID=UPI00315823B8